MDSPYFVGNGYWWWERGLEAHVSIVCAQAMDRGRIVLKPRTALHSTIRCHTFDAATGGEDGATTIVR